MTRSTTPSCVIISADLFCGVVEMIGMVVLMVTVMVVAVVAVVVVLVVTSG